MVFKAGVIAPDLSLVPQLSRYLERTRRPAAAIPKSQKFGRKQVFMPSFPVSMHRTPWLGPKWAKFSVPLWFSKLDLKDYLFHVYNVPVLRIRSYVKLGEVSQQRLIPNQGHETRYTTRRWHRARSTKTMTAELTEPFIWPEEMPNPEDHAQDHYKKQSKETRARRDAEGTTADAHIDKENRKLMREQYNLLKNGEEKWKAPETVERVVVR